MAATISRTTIPRTGKPIHAFLLKHDPLLNERGRTVGRLSSSGRRDCGMGFCDNEEMGLILEETVCIYI